MTSPSPTLKPTTSLTDEFTKVRWMPVSVPLSARTGPLGQARAGTDAARSLRDAASASVALPETWMRSLTTVRKGQLPRQVKHRLRCRERTLSQSADFRDLAAMRVREAKLLLDGGEWSGAYYLVGYAVEC